MYNAQESIYSNINVLHFSLSSVFAQDAASSDTGTTGNKPREQLSQNFVDALAAQDEKLLISAIESGVLKLKQCALKL